MTFSKLSRGGRVCGAGSRGQAEMLQQIYSLWRAGLGGGGLCLCLCCGSSLQGERELSELLGSSRQSETGPLKDEFSGALTWDMLCVRK